MYYVGTDIGGTFTDIVVLDDGGQVRVYKTPTTPHDRSQAVLEALGLAAADLGVDEKQFFEQIAYFAHGTTAATNALIERKGVRTGLITTRGFGDTIFIQRTMGSWAGMAHHEIAHYSARRLPLPIVERKLIREITERIDYKGSIIVPLDEEEVHRAVRGLIAEGVEAIAVCLLWSFRNPSHERAVGRIIREEAPGVFLTLSCELVPVLGEYERTATTVMNAYLGPIIARYVESLEQGLRRKGFQGVFTMMESGGGVLPANEAAQQAVTMLLSGPAGGVLASMEVAKRLGYRNVITTDMGGTSFDVGLIVDGKPLLSPGGEVGGYHISQPMVKVTAIGAGGGSIAHVEDGHLTVGPESAGANPGPACYGRGGRLPTVTDADVVLGIIDPDYFLGGRMKLDRKLAEEAIRIYVAEPLGMSVVEAAAAIRSVVDHQMADLIRRVTIRQGYDPRDFILLAYGGAGPTHCSGYGREANVRRIVIPALATALSAYGTVTSNRHRSFSLANPQHVPALFRRVSEHIDAEQINRTFAELEARCRAALNEDGSNDVRLHRFLSFRFRQQVHQIEVPVPSHPLTGDDVDLLFADFEKAYEAIYGKGTALREAGVEITIHRVEGIAPVWKPMIPRQPRGAKDPSAALLGRRRVYFYEESDLLSVKVYHGEGLKAGAILEGPAIIEHPGTTIVIGLGQVGFIDEYLNTIIEFSTKSDEGRK
jgi:N-methylhydantoinase A